MHLPLPWFISCISHRVPKQSFKCSHDIQTPHLGQRRTKPCADFQMQYFLIRLLKVNVNENTFFNTRLNLHSVGYSDVAMMSSRHWLPLARADGTALLRSDCNHVSSPSTDRTSGILQVFPVFQDQYLPSAALPSLRHGVYPMHRYPGAAVDLQTVPGAVPLPHHLPCHQPLVDQEGRPGERHGRCEGQRNEQRSMQDRV